MGFFSSKKCCICSKDVGIFSSSKCSDGAICHQCKKKVASQISAVAHASSEDLKSAMSRYNEKRAADAKVEAKDTYKVFLAFVEPGNEILTAQAFAEYGYSVDDSVGFVKTAPSLIGSNIDADRAFSIKEALEKYGAVILLS